MERGLKDEGLDLKKLEDPGDRYELQQVIGKGVYAQVYVAIDSQSGGKKVAIKVQTVNDETLPDIEEEYRILRDLSDHPNLPDFYGVYLKKEPEGVDKIWFVMQLCEGGPATDIVRGLIEQNKKMSEVHIAFLLKESIKALVFLHENHVIHRDVKGSNILLTKDGEVKLVDFGLSREVASTLGRKKTCLGTPCWMAPEVVTADTEYDNRADVWALGITAIELGDGRNPFEDMNPSRVLFQIVRNPPPTLYRPANWSQNYNDFIAECLTKNLEHRPFMSELLEHPFLTELPENDFHLNNELKTLLETVTQDVIDNRKPEVKFKAGLIKKNQEADAEELQVEDLAALETIDEDVIFNELEKRHSRQQYYTFIGDVLVFLNPNQKIDMYGSKYQSKYKFKSRSDNAPHIFSVADSAYQDMMHHGLPQNIVVTGESMSGKTNQVRHLIRQLISLGQTANKIGENIQKALEVIHAFGNAATPINSDSTRHALFTQVTFSKSGKTSGAIFWLYQLEKWRVTGNRCPQHANFHIFYYLFDGLADENRLDEFHLESSTSFRYLRREIEEQDKDPKAPPGPREDPIANVEKFKRIKSILTQLEFDEEQQQTIWKSMAAILLLGEVEFIVQDDGSAEIKDNVIVDKISELLSVDSKKLSWALCNYCVIEKDTAARRKHSRPEAVEAKNVLARVIYARLVDWIINTINHKFSFTRAMFGDSNCVNILDMFGFECYANNGIEQLFANTLNEQVQYYYCQKIFISEMDEQQEEGLPAQKFQFYNNKSTMDEIMNKPRGVLYLLDEANKLHRDADFVLELLKGKPETAHVRKSNDLEFSIAHYTGKVNYDASLLCHKNRDFLPPELTEVMRFSNDPIIKSGFTNKLSRTGNVTMLLENSISQPPTSKKRWSAALIADTSSKTRRHNTASKGEFSQTKGIRTAAAVFRATSLEVLRGLTTGGSHFVRCLRTDLGDTPAGFQPNLVRQQIRALALVDTANARHAGYSYRVPYDEFLRRYKFLAFDFDENVEETMDNCRLLLVRLKLEGYCMGKTKIFLKYYNEEYLARLYEIQVKKIVKVQAMLRTFLAKRNLANKQKKKPCAPNTANRQIDREMSEDTAAIIIQKHIKGYVARKKYGPLIKDSGKLDEETAKFIKGYAYKWKVKSMFQVLLLYRSARQQDLVYFSQQVHLYSQNVVGSLQMNLKEEPINLKNLQVVIDPIEFIGEVSPAVWKIPFKIKEFPFCDSSSLCGSYKATYSRHIIREDTAWDEPFTSLDKGCQTCIGDEDDTFASYKYRHGGFSNFIETPYCRDPDKLEDVYQNQKFPGGYSPARAKVLKHKKNKERAPELPSKYLGENKIPNGAVKNINPINMANNKDLQGTPIKQFNQQNINNGYSNKMNGSIARESPYKSSVQVNSSRNYVNNSKNNNDRKSPVRVIETDKNLNEVNGENVNFRKNLRETGKLKSMYSSDVNPIAEMEMKGKKMAKDVENKDEPPFNFQAMLRKTNYNRASLRRNQDGNTEDTNETMRKPIRNEDMTNNNTPKKINTPIRSSPSVKRPAPKPPVLNSPSIKNPILNSKVTASPPNSPATPTETTGRILNRTGSAKKVLLRKDSLETIKMMVATAKDFARDGHIDETGEISEDVEMSENFEEINTELIPGLYIMGHLAHV